MKKILGLDLGTTSIGWALVNEKENENEESSIIRLGVRVNPLTTDERDAFESGKAITTNAGRTLKRSMRRNLQRFKLRRENLIECLKTNNIITDDAILCETGNRTTFETYRNRAKAVTEKVSLNDFAKILLMINKKRGYKSSRKADNAEDGKLIDGMTIAKNLYENNITPAEYVLPLLIKGKKFIPDFYRSDLIEEFDKVWEKQKEFYPEILTDDFKKDIFNKGKQASSKIFRSKYDIFTADNKGKDKKLQSYRWRVDALSKQLSMEEMAYVICDINGLIANSSGYLGSISDRSKELYFNHLTVGQYIIKKLDENPNYSLKNTTTFYRQDYLDEFEAIWESQARFHPQLTPILKKEIRDIIIFYQRPLKSQKGLLSFCEFENKQIEIEVEGKKKTKTIGSKVCPKSSPVFQEFKIWQILNNLKVSDSESSTTSRNLEQEEKEIIFKELSYKNKLSKSDILRLLFNKPKSYNLNYDGVEGNRTQAALFNCYQDIVMYSGHGEFDFTKMKADEIEDVVSSVFNALGFNTDILHFDVNASDFDRQPSYMLWHLLYSYEGDHSKTGNESLVAKIMEITNFDEESAKILSAVTFQQDYGNLSTKAMRKILPFMQEGNEYSVACGYAGYKHSKKSLTKEELAAKTYKDTLELLPRNSLRNPVVEKILNQMINVINQIIESYGKPDEIRIELARELKSNAQERKKLIDTISQGQQENDEIRKILHDTFGKSHVSRNDIIRYKLYKELEANGYKTLYSNTPIPQEALFSKSFDIEHIIPQAKMFDDSLSNKTLEARDINIEKSNKTAFDFVCDKYGEQGAEQYKCRINNLYRTGKIKKAKYVKLLMTEAEIPSDFLERDLKNTQYIAVKAREILEELVPVVVPTTGKITDRLRTDWQLTDIMQELNWGKYDRLGLTESYTDNDGRIIKHIKDWTKRNDHRHHAMDALTIAFTKSSIIQYLNNLNARSDKSGSIYAIEQKELTRDKNGKMTFRLPLDNFRAEAKEHLENILISIKAKNKVMTQNVNTTKAKDGHCRKRIQLTPRGQLHNETVYGKIEKTFKGGVKKTFYPIRKPIDPTLKIEKVIDDGIRHILEARLEAFGGNAREAFSNLNENPIWLNKEKGIEIKRVTIQGVQNAIPLHDKKDHSGNLMYDKDGKTIPADYVQTSNNHHIAIFRDSNGKLHEHLVSFLEATERKRQGLPIIDKDYMREKEWTFLFSMKQNEYFVFPDEQTGFNPNDIDLLNPQNYKTISPHLYRVQKIASKYYVFRHHLETNVAEEKTLKDTTWKRINTEAGLAGIVKVRINHIGQIVAIGEY